MSVEGSQMRDHRSLNAAKNQFGLFGSAVPKMDKIDFPSKPRFGATMDEGSFCSKSIYLTGLTVISFPVFPVIPFLVLFPFFVSIFFVSVT